MNNFCVTMTISKNNHFWSIGCTTQYMQNNLKDSHQLIHYGNLHKVIYHIVNKGSGKIPDIDAFSHKPTELLLNLAQGTSPSTDTQSNRSSRT